MLRIENSNYNKEGSEFFVAGAAATGRAMDGSMIGWLPRVGLGRGTAGAPAGWLYGCKQAGTQAGRQAHRPKQNVRHPRFEQQWDTFHAREMESRHNGRRKRTEDADGGK